jgi:hypothetical protein
MNIYHEQTEVTKDDLPSIYVTVRGGSSHGLGQYAGRVALNWARHNGYMIVERLYSSVSATPGFAAGVESRYRIQKVAR